MVSYICSTAEDKLSSTLESKKSPRKRSDFFEIIKLLQNHIQGMDDARKSA